MMQIPPINRPALVAEIIVKGFTSFTKKPPHPNTGRALQGYILANMQKTNGDYYVDPAAIAHDLRHLWAGTMLHGFAYGTDIPTEHIVRLFEDIELLKLSSIPAISEIGINIIRIGQYCVSASIYNIAPQLFASTPQFKRNVATILPFETLQKMSSFIHQQFEELANAHPQEILGNQAKMQRSPQYQAFLEACNNPYKDLDKLSSTLKELRVLMLEYSGLHLLDFSALEAQRPSPMTRNKQWQAAIGNWEITQKSLDYSGLTPLAKEQTLTSFVRLNSTDVKNAQSDWKARKIRQQAEENRQTLRK